VLSRAAERQGLRAIHLVVAAAIISGTIAILRLKPDPSKTDQALMATCREWYAGARTRRDTLLIDNRVPQPRLQASAAYSCGKILGYH
jgi:hypothetical protein